MAYGDHDTYAATAGERARRWKERMQALARFPDNVLSGLEKGSADILVGGIKAAQGAGEALNYILGPKNKNINTFQSEGPMRLAGREVAHHGPVTSGGPLSRGNPWERQMGRTHAYFRPGGRWEQEYFAKLDEEERERMGIELGYGEGQVDPGFYRAPQNPVYQNRIAINADNSALEKELTAFEAQLEAELGNALPYTTGVAAGDTAFDYGQETGSDINDANVFDYGPTDRVDTRSDWQKWKDSFKKDWAVAK